MDSTIIKDEDGEELNILETLADEAQLEGRDIEEQIMMQDTLLQVLTIAKERGVAVEPKEKGRAAFKYRSTLRNIWVEVTAVDEDR